MTRSLIVSGVAALIIAAASVGVAQAQKESSKNKPHVIYVAAAQATFKQSPMAGVSMAVLWDDPDKAAYGTFTKFAPGYDAGTHIRAICGWSLSKARISTRMKRAKSVWGREISSESRAPTSIGAAVTRRKARSFIRKGRRNSMSYR